VQKEGIRRLYKCQGLAESLFFASTAEMMNELIAKLRDKKAKTQ